MFLLDTNACIRILNAGPSSVRRQFERRATSDIAVCGIVKAELLYGARRSSRVEENLYRIEALCEPLVSLPFDDGCADAYGRIRSVLETEGNPIGPNDLLIAATALAFDVTLVTHNTREFNRVPGLRMVDWEAGE